MKIEHFRVHKDGWQSYFEVYVAPTRKAMHKLIAKISKARGWPSPATSDLRGVGAQVSPVKTTDDCFATMFLNKDDLTPAVIAHECAHVAFAYDRFVLRFGMNYGDGMHDLDDEERFCYYLGHCVEAVSKGIKRPALQRVKPT